MKLKIYLSTTAIVFITFLSPESKASESYKALSNHNEAISNIRKLPTPSMYDVGEFEARTQKGMDILGQVHCNAETIAQLKSASLQEWELARRFVINQAISVYAQRTGYLNLGINNSEKIRQNQRYIRHTSVVATWSILTLYLLEKQTKSFFLDETVYGAKVKKHLVRLIDNLGIKDNTFKNNVLQQIKSFEDSDFNIIFNQGQSLHSSSSRFRDIYLELSNKNNYNNVSRDEEMENIHQNYIMLVNDQRKKNLPPFFEECINRCNSDTVEYGHEVRGLFGNHTYRIVFFPENYYKAATDQIKKTNSYVCAYNNRTKGFYLSNSDVKDHYHNVVTTLKKDAGNDGSRTNNSIKSKLQIVNNQKKILISLKL